MKNLYNDTTYAKKIAELKMKLNELQLKYMIPQNN